MLFGHGEGAVNHGLLSSFDPTMLLNGSYALRLTAETDQGTASATIAVTVTRNMKVGLFTLTWKDLDVPVAGVPMQIFRTYDSRDKRKGDFGVGWTLGIKNVRVETTVGIGAHWHLEQQGFSQCLAQSRPLYATVTFPTGKVYRFSASSDADCVVFGVPEGELAFTSLDPTKNSTLAPLNDTLFYYGGGRLLGANSGQPINPTLFQLTTEDGTVYYLQKGVGVTSMVDRNGNTLTINSDGIIHSSGKRVTFHRDAQGRIDSITDPAGQTLTYQYDADGNLASFKDRAHFESTFEYVGDHDLWKYHDPRGKTAITNTYYADGRLESSTDALGHTIQYQHDLVGQQEVVTDRRDFPTTYTYDDHGNVTQVVDARGGITTNTHDGNDCQTGREDPLHHATTWTRDGSCNALSETDALTKTTTYTYNNWGQVLTTEDPLQHTTTNHYDGKGNLDWMEDALHARTSYSYDAAGNRTYSKDPLNAETWWTYDSAGNRLTETDALLHTTTWTYDANNRVLSETRVRTHQGAPQNLATIYIYDGNGNTMQTTAPDGAITKATWDGLGHRSDSTDARNFTTTYTYDDAGRLTSTLHPDGYSELVAYDDENHVTSRTDRGSHTTTFGYDELGRRTKTTYHDGTFTLDGFDAAGRKTSFQDERGNVWTYGYDDAGRRTSETAPGRPPTAYVFDDAGRQTDVTDALSHTVHTDFDENDRPTTVHHPGGLITTSTEYDDGGNVTARVDEQQVRTEYGYDGLRHLTEVVQDVGGLAYHTTYGYDEVGSRVAQTDAKNHSTTFEYDKAGRRTKRTLPLGKYESMTYDPSGNLVTKTDFNGRTTTYEYDRMNRLITRTPDARFNAPIEHFAYTPDGQRDIVTDGRGDTVYTYDDRERVTSVTDPSGRSLGYTYHANGARKKLTLTVGLTVLATLYGYDADGHLATVTDPQNLVYTVHTNDDGLRTGIDAPNGANTTYQYDSLHRLTDLDTWHGQVHLQKNHYTVRSDGLREAVDELGSTHRAYGYDGVQRLTSEAITHNNLAVYSKTFTYDAVGNRSTQVHTDGQGAVTKSYSYDDRDRLLTETGLSYSWDDSGNLTNRTGGDGAANEWDYQDRLTKVTLGNGTVVQHSYDVDGNRVRTLVTPQGGAATTTDFVIDAGGGLSQVIADVAGGAVTAYYVRSPELLGILRGGDARYAHADGLGSIRLLTDDQGGVTDTYTYTAFGELLEHTGSDPQPWRFAGEAWQPETNLAYHRARWMDPAVGRFSVPDRLQMTNLYLYSSSDPVNRLDPTGNADYNLPSIAAAMTIMSNLAARGGALVGSIINQGATRWEAFKQLGAQWESAVVGVLESVPALTGRVLPQFRVAYSGSIRVLDAAIEDTDILVEAKYTLPRVGTEAFTRMVQQGSAAVANGYRVVFSLSKPGLGSADQFMQAIVDEAGPQALDRVDVVYGAQQLVQWFQANGLIR